MHLFSILSIALSVIVISTAQSPPALLWSPERSMVDLPDVSGINTFTAKDFYNQYLSPVMNDGKGSSIIFLQDKLSVEDFTKYADVFSINSDGGSFKNIKRLIDDHFSLEIEQVESPHVSVDSLKKSFKGKVHTINDPSQLNSLRLTNGDRFLLIVNLNPITGVKDVKKTISDNDAIIGEITQYLHKRGIEYAALFTGKTAEVPENEGVDGEDVHSGRHLLATADTTESCAAQNVSDNVLVYLCGFEMCIMTTTSTKASTPYCYLQLNSTFDNTTDIASSSTKDNNTATLKLVFKDIKSLDSDAYNVEIDIETNLQGDRWTMDKLSVNLSPATGSKGNITLKNAILKDLSLDTTIPRLYSFHCTQFTLTLDTLNGSYTEYAGSYVQLNKFQFQVFDTPSDGFFFAQDCVGFFTAGIWMGIVPGVIMLGILLWGTLMVLNLSVMDKFDNPKGKTIIVNTGE